MLVLTRKAGQSILIGKDIIIKVIGVSGNQVELGIEAPRNLLILREELLKEIEEFTKKSSELNVKELQVDEINDLKKLLDEEE